MLLRFIGIRMPIARRVAVTGLALILASTLGGCVGTAPQTQGRTFSFGVVGDAPYTRQQEKDFPNVIAAMNQAELAFIVHIGDFQADPREYYRQPKNIAMPCTDALLEQSLRLFQTSKHPFILTPGDNDWTDCHFLKEHHFDPLERLDTLRAMFYPPARSLGQRTMPVLSQASDPKFAKFRENLRWSSGGVTFVTLHTVGSNDNLGRLPEMDEEQTARAAASSAWMRQAFAVAKTEDSLGLVIFTQAN